MIKFFKKLFCIHDFELQRIIYGDEILYRNARQEWKCKKCGKYFYI